MGSWGPAGWGGGGSKGAASWGPSTSSSKSGDGKSSGGIGGFAKRFGSDLLHAGENLPGGLYTMAKAPVTDTINFVEHPLSPTRSHATLDVAKATAKSIVDTTEHPGRHPGLFTLNLLAALSGGAGAVARVGEAADVARAGGTAGDIVKAAATKPAVKPRLFKVGDETTNLHPSRNTVVRVGQGVYDKKLQKAIAEKPEGKVAAHAYKRLGGSMAETRRYQTALKESSAKQIASAGEKLPKKQRQAMKDALRLTSEQTTPREAMKTAKREIAAGNEVETNKVWLQRLRDVKAGGYVKIDQSRPAGQQVHIDEARHPQLAALDQKIAKGALRRDEALAKVGEMTPEQLQQRVNEPNLVHKGAVYEKPTPGKLGVPSQGLIRQRAYTARLEGLATRAQERVAESKFTPDQIKAINEPGVTERVTQTRPRTRDEAQRQLARLDTQWDTAVEKASAYMKGGAPLDAAETARRNVQRAKFDRQNQGVTRAGTTSGTGGRRVVQRRPQTLSQEFRDQAEAKLVKTLEAYPSNSTARRLLQVKQQRDELRATLNESHTVLGSGAPADFGQVKRRVEAPVSAQRVGNLTVTPRGALARPTGSARAANLNAALSVSKDRLQQMEAAAARREKPTGFVGASGARPGRNFVSYALTEPKGASADIARSPGPIVGDVKNIVPKQSFTGEGLRAGLVPQDTTGIVSRGMIRAARRVDTEQFRGHLARMGSDVKRTPSDVLVSTQEIKSAPIGDVDKALLGQKRLNFNEEVAHATNFRDWLEQAIPGHRDKFAADKTHPLGAQAPEGYKWVPKQLLGELGKAPQFNDPGWFVRRLNDVNAAVTTATVYVKPGHILTRYGTNALANVLQGSATPRGIGMSVGLWKSLGHEDRVRALAAAGQPGFDALPHEGSDLSAVPRAIQAASSKGSRWWAVHADAPFRFNSIAFEARKAGFKTPAQFRELLDKLENPEGLNAAQRAKVDYVARRANREQIAYDRLSEFEKRYLTRLFWFYPWTRAAINFAGNTILEHPVKAAAIGRIGQVGAEQQAQQLGPLPGYEGGLFKIGGSAGMPTVLNLSTVTPFTTPADVGKIAAGLVTAPKSSAQLASGMFNPGLSALGNLAYGLDQYGNPIKGVPLEALARALVSATPESGLATDLSGDQSKRMFPTPGLLPAIEHFLTKPGGPRKLNRAIANASAAKEASGRSR